MNSLPKHMSPRQVTKDCLWLQDDSKMSCDDLLDEIEGQLAAISTFALLHIPRQGSAADEAFGREVDGAAAHLSGLLPFFLQTCEYTYMQPARFLPTHNLYACIRSKGVHDDPRSEQSGLHIMESYRSTSEGKISGVPCGAEQASACAAETMEVGVIAKAGAGSNAAFSGGMPVAALALHVEATAGGSICIEPADAATPQKIGTKFAGKVTNAVWKRATRSEVGTGIKVFIGTGIGLTLLEALTASQPAEWWSRAALYYFPSAGPRWVLF